MSLPIWAKGPVRGARKPILIGAPWAAGAAGVSSGTQTASRSSSDIPRLMAIPLFMSAVSSERAENSARGEQADADVDGAQDEQPALGVDAHEVFQEHDDGGAQRGAGQ